MLCQQARTRPDLATFVQAHNDWYREALTGLLDSLAEGWIKPVVAERIPLLGRGGYAGKVVLVTSAESGFSNLGL